MTARVDKCGMFPLLLLAVCAAIALGSGCAALRKTAAPPLPAMPRPEQKPIGDKAAGADSLAGMDRRYGSLSPASQLLLAACDNYLSTNPQSGKAAEVLVTKASLLYNNRLYDDARASYRAVVDRFPRDARCVESVRMIAQSYYEEGSFDESQAWYRRFKDQATDAGDKEEAAAHIAEAMFKTGERLEAGQKFGEAAAAYERVANEFPDAKIADASLFNTGLMYEKLADWPNAATVYGNLVRKYPWSKVLAKAHFRMAQCYEKLQRWNDAGETYLRIVADFPASEFAPTSLANAGLCFENAGKLSAAAATFEKMAQQYPKSEDAADALFRAGEMYGKINDWGGVERVNQEFMRRYGGDASRAVQALCMQGVALAMQNRQTEAQSQLKRAVGACAGLREPSAANKYYAAKAQLTIGEIQCAAMNRIALPLSREAYKRQLKSKSDLLDDAVASYSEVVKYQILEWTTRSINAIGRAYEDFGTSISRQERPANAGAGERLALELGIAQAVEEYFVNKAAHYHEENVKLGIKENIEDKYVIDSRRRLAQLPLLAGRNYLALVDMAQGPQRAEGLAAVAKKLETLRKIEPYQERAMALFVACLENGSRYRMSSDSSVAAAGTLAARTSFLSGEAYAGIAAAAREAPLPASFDPYESFVYKTKLLKQIEAYEEKAVANYLRTLTMAAAYGIDNDFAKQSKVRLPQLLFERGRCYDVLCMTAFLDPPFPRNANAAEKEEYRARFEETGLKLQESAFAAYKLVLSYAKQNLSAGEFVTHAYVRMFQKLPREYGTQREKTETHSITSGTEWKCSADTAPGWSAPEFKDEKWHAARPASLPPGVTMAGFPSAVPPAVWFGEGDPASAAYSPASAVCFRRTFFNYDDVKDARLWLAGSGECAVFLNGKALPSLPGDSADWTKAKRGDLRRADIKNGANVLAVRVKNNGRAAFAFMASLVYTVRAKEFVPQPPGAAEPLDPKQCAEGVYAFPVVPNFPVPAGSVKKEASRETP